VLSLARLSRNVSCMAEGYRPLRGLNYLIGGLVPGAYAPGFMLASAPRTHPVATALGTDLIAPRANPVATAPGTDFMRLAGSNGS